MEKTLLFSIAVVFCFRTFIASAKEVSEVDVSISQTEITNYTPVDTAVNKEFNFNGSELEVARADECKCKNGKCMRVCDVEKATPCMDKRMVCVCNPGFGEKDKGECEYCDCGQGINCTFQNFYDTWFKTCICPEGYYKDTYADEKCRLKCSEERPCQNGGTCNWSKRCICPNRIEGDLCEEIVGCSSKCENRLEVDCLYNQRERVVYCSCKNSSLYYDQEAGICKPCPCENGFCDYEYGLFGQKLICHCHPGYKEFNGYCKECDCHLGVDGRCEFDSKGEKICKCQDGFYEREGRCYACGCFSWSDMDTKCEVTGNVKRCFCKEGYKDVFGHCEEINQCETNNTCHPSSTCYDLFGNFYCQCPRGYKGADGDKVEPGEVCEDIDECEESLTACWYWDNVKCVNLPGSYKCECFQGYEPRSYSDEPYKTTCVKASKNWGPAVIVIFTTLILMVVSCLMDKRVKRRAARSN